VSVAAEFEKVLERGLLRLDEDEWAIAQAKGEILARLEPSEAFDAIAGVLQVAAKQKDPFCFATCCWFVLDLARKADTTAFPSSAFALLSVLESRAAVLGENCPNELANIIQWFRLPSNPAVQGTLRDKAAQRP